MFSRTALFLAVAAAGLIGCDQHSASPAQPKEAVVLPGNIGSRLPEFSAKDLQGRAISSSELRGKVVLVDFWATWCQPCKQEMPGYQRLADEYGSRGFAVIGFKATMMKDVEDPLRFAKKIGVHYPLVVATDDLMQKFGGIEGLPTTLLYDRQGILRNKVIGFEYNATFAAEVKTMLGPAGDT
jgi:thiol-disulfide isomerase/thioredoxin